MRYKFLTVLALLVLVSVADAGCRRAGRRASQSCQQPAQSVAAPKTAPTQPTAPSAAPIVQASDCANGQCSVPRAGLFRRR